ETQRPQPRQQRAGHEIAEVPFWVAQGQVTHWGQLEQARTLPQEGPRGAVDTLGETTCETAVAHAAWQSAPPALFGEVVPQVGHPFPLLAARRVVGRQLRMLTGKADVLGPGAIDLVAVLLEPVGEDEARGVVLRRVAHRQDERVAGRHRTFS